MESSTKLLLTPIHYNPKLDLTLYVGGENYAVSLSDSLNHWPTAALKKGLFPNVCVTLRDNTAGFITLLYFYLEKTSNTPSEQLIDIPYVISAIAQDHLERLTVELGEKSTYIILNTNLSTLNLPDHNGEVSGYVTITHGLYYWAEQAIDEELTTASLIGNYFEGQEWNDKIVDEYLEKHKRDLLLRDKAVH